MKLSKFKINSGGKFNESGPIVIDFSQSNMVGIKSDEGGGKTTICELLLMNCGQLGGEKVVEALKNKKSGDIDTELTFKDGKADYEVKLKNGRLNIKREGEKLAGGPQELLKQMLGVVGVSPMGIKNASIEEIVKWLASYSTRSAEEFEKEMAKYKDGIKKAKKTRADANKSAKGLKEYLSGEGYVGADGEINETKWKQSETKYKTRVDINALSARLDAAGAKTDKYVQNETKVKGQKDRKKQIEEQIALLQEELKTVDRNIELGDKWLADNKNAKKEYDAIREEYDNVSKEVIAYEKWQDIKRKKKEMDDFQDISISADASEKQFIKKQQELQWEVIPDIKGVEIILEDTHEDEGEQVKAGFYYNGLNSRQLSESEWFGLVIQILKKNKVKLLIVDGVANLGSKFMETLEALAKSGCYILYTEMSRGSDEIEIVL